MNAGRKSLPVKTGARNGRNTPVFVMTAEDRHYSIAAPPAGQGIVRVTGTWPKAGKRYERRMDKSRGFAGFFPRGVGASAGERLGSLRLRYGRVPRYGCGAVQCAVCDARMVSAAYPGVAGQSAVF